MFHKGALFFKPVWQAANRGYQPNFAGSNTYCLYQNHTGG